MKKEQYNYLHLKNEKNKDKKYFYLFFSLLLIVTIFLLFFSYLIHFIFPSPNIKLDNFDFKLHRNLTFDDSYRGTNPNAKIDFVVFMDFRCSACIDQYPVIRNLIANHTDVNFLIKHLVRENDELSFHGAKAFECSKIYSKEFEMADYLIESQYSLNDLYRYAEILGIDQEKFNECMNSEIINNIIKADMTHGAFLGVRGTPTVFLNGIKIEGVNNYEVFNELINNEIKFYNSLEQK